ncbi:hypothetical protein AAC03nite_10170 [Alicyclobacillus acidoterrestris]|uniref:EAL domain-containing protein n=1 Tax=Alicyclobacillus suci TaxID=2816080 RepID=UPI00118EF1CE|nr:EAL domain-containing protein [Alicyclobacillus suci]GEO25232.1 hypothetical protein AAC03nite_10170 [Alicyclobacillus acidoterrestris]
MGSAFVGWILQTWLLSAQVFSTREFAQLAVYRVYPAAEPWFIFILLPLGFALDGGLFHVDVSAGIFGILYATVYVLHARTWKLSAFVVTTVASFLLEELWYDGVRPQVWISVGLLCLLIAIISPILTRWNSMVGMLYATSLCVLGDGLFWLIFHRGVGSTVVALLTGVMSGMYVNFRNQHDQFVRETHHAVQHDVLTGALTRRGLTTWINDLRRHGVTYGIVIFCDLDNFKWINDTWGHEVGDSVLREFVSRIRAKLRTEDAIARFGGDEFKIFLPMEPGTSGDEVVRRLHQAATSGSYAVLQGGAMLDIGVSMGWAQGEFNEATANEADKALLTAKRSGKNCVLKARGYSDTTEPCMSIAANVDANLYWLTNIAQSLWADAYYPFVLTDARGQIIVANQAYANLVGRNREELQGNKPSISRSGKTPRRVYESMWNNLSHGRPWSGCLLNRRKDGGEWWEVAELFPVTLSGQIVGYWGLVQDLHHAQFPEVMNREYIRWHGHIDWVFQPIFDAATEEVVGYEALARPKWGEQDISPETFFRIAEKLRFYSQADWDCLDSLLERLEEVSWPKGVRLFLNVYVASLSDTGRMQAWLSKFYQQHPDVICVFEILEHHHGQQEIDLNHWYELQLEFPLIELAQDDFGAGEQDVIRLVNVMPNWVKLDRAWVGIAETHPESRDLLYAMTRWARAQGIRVIGEGLETRAQADMYMDLGIAVHQGYYWSHPGQQLVASQR